MKIVRISAIWCPSCIIMRKIYDEVTLKYNLESIELDYDFDEEKVKELNVGTKLPVIIIYKEGKELKRIIGEHKLEEVESIMEELL